MAVSRTFDLYKITEQPNPGLEVSIKKGYGLNSWSY